MPTRISRFFHDVPTNEFITSRHATALRYRFAILGSVLKFLRDSFYVVARKRIDARRSRESN
jgi:hypothetical protein